MHNEPGTPLNGMPCGTASALAGEGEDHAEIDEDLKRLKLTAGEFRIALMSIRSFSSTLLEGVDCDMYDKEEQKEFLGIIVSECDRLRRLVDDVHLVSRIFIGESLEPQYTRFELLPLLQRLVADHQGSTNRHHVRLDVYQGLPVTIVGDRDKFVQILTNLLNNAIKYSPNGGDVTVHAKTDGEYILIGVQDQGLGIPKEHLGKVFEKFHRVNNDDNRKIYGTGLGLFLVKHLVDKVYMGEIWAESELNVGSTFWFRMPKELDWEKAIGFNA